MPDDGVAKAGTHSAVLQARIASLEAELEAARARIAELEAGIHKKVGGFDRVAYQRDLMQKRRRRKPLV